jgi:hypothetical protein
MTPGEAILRHFTYDHLPAELAAVSKPFSELANALDAQLAGPETTTALRKLLEAKDCAVRAARFEARPPS